MKIAIAIPSARDWKVTFGASLLSLTRHLTNIPHEFYIMKGASNLPRARRLAVKWANDIHASHLLCLDDDMQFSPKAIDSLISRKVDIVACNYISKATHNPLVHDLDGKILDSTDKSGLQEVGWIPLGVTLIRLASISHVPNPLFEMVWLEEKQDDLGEDFYFCKKVREHGLKVHVDHDASQMVAHVGDYPFAFHQSKKAEAA